MRNRDDLAPVMRETRNGLSLLFGDRLEDVLLYGSFARGTQDEESDVDVMALVRLPQEELSHYRRQVSDFSSALDLKYDDEFTRHCDTLPFYRNVMREGISYV